MYKIEACEGGSNMTPKKPSPSIMSFEISTLRLTCLQRLIKENYMVEIKPTQFLSKYLKG